MQRAVFCYLDDFEDIQIDLKKLVVKDECFLAELSKTFPFVYRLPERSTMLQQVCKERRWKAFGDSSSEEERPVTNHLAWNLLWKTSVVKNSRPIRLRPWQTINQIPNASNFCRKDVLVRYLRRMKTAYPQTYDFCPVSFNMPTEYLQLVAEHRRRKEGAEKPNRTGMSPLACLLSGRSTPQRESNKGIWIAKPVGKSQGKGIFVFENATELRYDDQYVVQEYISRPLLINGYKWDLRLYVCVTCNKPLTVYAYREGIARFATKKYDLNNLGNHFSHLTNTSLNKQSPTYDKNKDTVGFGSKWTLAQLREHFRKENIQDYFLWQRIWSVLLLTIIGDGKEISLLDFSNNGFQFLGFDVLVDRNLKPHLLEVNVHPGLGSDKYSSVDIDVKIPMLHEMFDLIGLPDGRKLNNSEGKILGDGQILCEKILAASKEAESKSHRPNFQIVSGDKGKPISPLQSRLLIVPEHQKASVVSVIESSKSSKNGRSRNSTDLLITATKAVDRNNNDITSFETSGPPDPQDTNNVGLKKLSLRSGAGKEATRQEASVDDTDSTVIKGGPQRYVSWVAFAPLDMYNQPVVKMTNRKPTIACVPVLRGTKRLQFPINGPGLCFVPRNWRTEAPQSCGNWVRIFPFDEQTQLSSNFSRNEDIRESIIRVTSYLQKVKEIVGCVVAKNEYQRDDEMYDVAVKMASIINTDVWHPILSSL